MYIANHSPKEHNVNIRDVKRLGNFSEEASKTKRLANLMVIRYLYYRGYLFNKITNWKPITTAFAES